MKDMLEILQEHRIVAILRGITGEQADPTAEALCQGGVKLLEATMNTEGALQLISRWRERFDGRVAIGAGTVLNVRMATDAVAAGAQFLISPNLDEAVIAYACERGVEIWPGVMTPSEIVRAYSAGARAVKIFPMATLGLGYLKEIRAPLDHIPMLATGGVTLANIGEFLAAGAAGVGLGSSLVPKALLQAGDYEGIARNTAQFTAAVAAFQATT
jgi:2-dehydro-3-deoxyphosphogluconate aldolase/(4S)-4-hydroxy-2-oxoglutarate aldolase